MSKPDCGALAHATMASLGAFFAGSNHNPSPDHWRALEEAANAME